MVIIGKRILDPQREDDINSTGIGSHMPRVSIYEGKNTSSNDNRQSIFSSMRNSDSKNSVRSFTSCVSPNDLSSNSWAEVVMTKSQLKKRHKLRQNAQILNVNPEQGVQTNADSMRKGCDRYLSQEVLRNIGWPEKKAGIFVITEKEMKALGVLTKEEQRIIRPIVSTKDLFPYACIAQLAGNKMIHLHSTNKDASKNTTRLYESFPDNMPNLEKHLMQFKALLEYKVKSYSEETKRPWWSVHRPKLEILYRDNQEGEWADYCLTQRWGTGKRLIVGLAPSNSIPLSGLYALMTEDRIPGAYLCGMLNSSIVQELAETLPPGVIRSNDLEEIGIPHLPSKVDEISATTLQLASTVKELISVWSSKFPTLMESIRISLSFHKFNSSVWQPTVGNDSNWGKLSRVHWINDIATSGSISNSIAKVTVVNDLLGRNIIVTGDKGGEVRINIINSEVDIDVLICYLESLTYTKRKLSDVLNLPVPIVFDVLLRLRMDDVKGIHALLSRYKELRKSIDDIVSTAI